MIDEDGDLKKLAEKIIANDSKIQKVVTAVGRAENINMDSRNKFHIFNLGTYTGG